MKELFLSEPNIIYAESFKNYALAYKKINDSHYYNKYKLALENFQGYLDLLYNYSIGRDLAIDDVITSTFWLIDQKEVVGVVRIRHKNVEFAGNIGYDISPNYRNKGYGFHLLQLSLEKSLSIGLDEVILTCTINNIPSKKIIEKNNGKFLETIFNKEDKEYMLKYSITLTNN